MPKFLCFFNFYYFYYRLIREYIFYYQAIASDYSNPDVKLLLRTLNEFWLETDTESVRLLGKNYHLRV